MTTLLSYPAIHTSTSAFGYPTYDDLMAAVQHIYNVMGEPDTMNICHGMDCDRCAGYHVEWTEIWDTVHRLLDPDFKERWVEMPGDGV